MYLRRYMSMASVDAGTVVGFTIGIHSSQKPVQGLPCILQCAKISWCCFNHGLSFSEILKHLKVA